MHRNRSEKHQPDPSSARLTVPQLLLTPQQAAEALAVSERTLWGLTHPRGPIRSVRVGRAVRYSVAALQRWVESTEAAAGEGAA